MRSCAHPTAPRAEHRTDGSVVLGAGTATPRLSWTVPRADAGWEQTAYEIEIERDGAVSLFLVDSTDQVLVPWPDRPLDSREQARVRVRVACRQQWSDWSPAAVIEAGLFDATQWSAKFVSPVGVGGLDSPAPILTGLLDIPGEVVRARLYVTAHGVFNAQINGHRVGDEVLAPGWTAYEHRLRYRTHDVTDLVRQGGNRLEVLLGNGWWRGRLGFLGQRAQYGERLALLAQLEVLTRDGQVHVLNTDETWTARESEVVADDLYDGQRTDLRRASEQTAAVHPVEVLEEDLERLVAPEGPPVRATGELPALHVWQSPGGRILVDFGQNLVGWVRLRVRGLAAGEEVSIRHAEVLENDELGVRPLRSASATDSYVLAGPDEVSLEPSLTFHGFRYAEVTGVPDLQAGDITAVVVGSDLPRTGWFESSDPLLDRFHENVVWGMRGNFLDVPTDCPQRDERLGWTGDIQVFSPTAAFLCDSAGFLGSWLQDLAAEQQPDGSVPHVVPDILRDAGPAAAAWGDAAVVVPWVLHERTGDTGVLSRQYPSMRAWVDRVAALAGDKRLWTGGFQFGDWLDPSAPPEAPARAMTHPDVVATAHFARSAGILARTAAVLGRDADADHYTELAAQVRQAFAHHYVTPTGRVLSDSQTAYAMALEWDLLPTPEQRAGAAARLADLVRLSGFRISTGFVGTPLVADALESAGYAPTAYRLLLQTGCPSWLYPVTMGATTVWERWDSMLPDGTINAGEMTSFNHYALGAVADWLHRRVAGLAPAAPGYRRIEVRPSLDAALTSAGARHLTPYGEASVRWQRGEGELRLDVRVPVGATAEVHVPGSRRVVEVGHGEHTWTVPDPVAEPAKPGPGATVRDILDDPRTWSDVVAAAKETGVAPRGEAETAERLAYHLDSAAAQLATALAPVELYIPGARALHERLSDLAARTTA